MKSASGLGAKTWQMSVQVPAGPGKVLAEYAHTQVNAVTSQTLEEYAVGYDYNLSKRTDLYVNYLYSKDSLATSTGSALGFGMRHAF